MINFIVYLVVGLVIGCWVLSVEDKELETKYKLLLTVAVACFGWVVNSLLKIDVISVVGLVIGVISLFVSIALCKVAKEN